MMMKMTMKMMNTMIQLQMNKMKIIIQYLKFQYKTMKKKF